MLVKVLLSEYKYPNNTVNGVSGQSFITGNNTNWSSRLVGKRLYIKDYGYVTVSSVPNATQLNLTQPLSASFSNKIWFEDLSEALIDLGDISKKIEGEDNLYQSGTILFDEINIRLYIDNSITNKSIESVRNYFLTNLSNANKYYILLRLCKDYTNEEYTIYHGFVDFSSIIYDTLKDSSGLIRKTIKFNILDKISSLTILNISDTQRGSWNSLFSRYLGVHGNISSLGTNQWEHIYLSELTNNDFIGQLNPFHNSHDNDGVVIIPTYYTYNSVAKTLIKTLMQSSNNNNPIINNCTFYLSGGYTGEVTITTPSSHSLSVGDFVYVYGGSLSAKYVGNYIVTEIVSSTSFKTKCWSAPSTPYSTNNVSIQKTPQTSKKLNPGETITVSYPYFDFGKNKDSETEEGQFTFYIADSFVIRFGNIYYTAVKTIPHVPTLYEGQVSPDYTNVTLGDGSDIKFFSVKYLENKYYNSSPNYIDIFETNNYRYNRSIIKYLDAIKIIERIFSYIYQDITIINKLYDSSGNIITQFKIPAGEANLLIDSYPFGKSPLEAVIMLANLFDAYIFINNDGNLVIQNKKSFDYIAPSSNIIPDNYLNIIEERYFWDNLYDAVSVYVKSYIPSLTENLKWDGRYLDGAGYATLFPGIKARNELSIEIPLSYQKIIDLGYTINNKGFISGGDGTQYDLLNEIADSFAQQYLNFYGKRHASFSLEAEKFDWSFRTWNLCDIYYFNGIKCFLTNFKFNIYKNTFSALFIEVESHDFYEKPILVIKKDDGYISGSSGGSSSSTKISYTINKYGLFWSGASDYLNPVLGRESLQLPTWINSGIITTVGIITSGKWRGDLIESEYGGTGVNNDKMKLTLRNPETSEQSLSILYNDTYETILVNTNRTISTSHPLTGGGQLSNNILLSLLYDSNSFKLVSNKLTPKIYDNGIPSQSPNLVIRTSGSGGLDTIQPISTTSTPQFAKLGIGIPAGSDALLLVSQSKVSTSDYISGWTGTGWKIDWTSNNGYTAIFDNLFIRGALTVYELIINQIRATNGSLFVTSAAKIEAIIDPTPQLEIVRFEDPHHTTNKVCPFAVGDIVLIQELDLSSGTQQVIKRIVRKVDTVSNNQVAFTTSGLSNPPSIGTIEVGDTVVRIGNAINANRRGVVYLTSDDVSSPYIDVVDGIANWSDWGNYTKIKARLGKLDGYTFGGQSLSGYGLVSENVYLSGTIYSNTGGFGGTVGNPYVKLNQKGIIIGGSGNLVPTQNGLTAYNSSNQETFSLSDGGSLRIGKLNDKRIEYSSSTGLLKIIGDVNINDTLTMGDGTTVGKIRTYGLSDVFSSGSGIFLTNDTNARFRVGLFGTGGNISALQKGLAWDGNDWAIINSNKTIIKSLASSFWNSNYNDLVTKGIIVNYSQINEDFETGSLGDDNIVGWTVTWTHTGMPIAMHSTNGLTNTYYHSGSKSYLLAVYKTSSPYPLIKPSAYWPYYTLASLTKTLTVGTGTKTYFASIWVKIGTHSNSYDSICLLRLSDSNGNSAKKIELIPYSSTNWREIRVSLTTSASSINLEFLWSATSNNVPNYPLVNTNDMASIYIDDLKVYESNSFVELSSTGLYIFGDPNRYFKISNDKFEIKGIDLETTGIEVKGDLIVRGNTMIEGDISAIPPDYNPSNWNQAYDNIITSANFNTTNGNLTLNKQAASNIVVNLDGRYYSSPSDIRSLFSATAPLTYTSSTGVFALSYNATNLKLTSNALNTIQDIATTSTPTFNQVNLSVDGTTTQAVRGGRTISTSAPLTGGGDLTANRTLALSYNATNLKLTSNALNTIQDIATTSTPTFNQVILSNAGTSTQAVRGDRSISTSAPLTGGGDLTANRTLALSYNSTNLKLTSNELNTIQDIATTSSPTFANLTINQNLIVNRIGSVSRTNYTTTGEDSTFFVSTSLTGQSGSLYRQNNLYLYYAWGTGNSNPSWWVRNINSRFAIEHTSSDATVGELSNAVFTLEKRNSGNITNLNGFYVGFDDYGGNGSGTITNLYLVRTESNYTNTNLTVTTAIGLYIPVLKATTNAYGIRIDGVSGSNAYNLYLSSDIKSYINGQLGVGIANPTEKIETNGNIKALTGKFTNLTDGYIPYHQSDSVGLVDSVIYTNGTNVRIGGSTAPAYKLDVQGTGRFTLALQTDNIFKQFGASGTNEFNADIEQKGNKSIYNTFTSGWTGAGWRLDYGITATNRSHLELDDLTVRGTMRVYELIINQIRATNGSLFVSSSAKVVSSNLTTGDPELYTITFEDPDGHNVCPFAVGDILLVQRVRLDSTTLVKQIAIQVTSVTGMTINSNVLYRNGTINKNDLCVRIGNVSNENRRGSVYLTSDDSNAPYIDIVDEVNSWSAWGS